MTDIGVEVGQKMRSAIKAKLMELECYVDDELPDYIMVMVANKRTKSQMNEDLQLFLASKTATFVEWLHIVLKKLKEVHVTNPNVFKKSTKRKIDDPELEKQIKKEKKDSKIKRLTKRLGVNVKEESAKSLTDDLPMNIKIPETRKVTLQESTSSLNDGDVFDIPTITEVNSSTETELRILEKQIKSAKSRLGVVVNSESDDDFLNLKAEPDDLFPNEQSISKREKITEHLRKVNMVDESLTPPIPQLKSSENMDSSPPKATKEHSRIVFDLDNSTSRKKSALERLGKRKSSDSEDVDFRGEKEIRLKKSRISLSEIRKEEEKLLGIKKHDKSERKRIFNKDNLDERAERGLRESALSRLGVMSKVAVPKKPPNSNEDVEEEISPNKEVPSVVKVKPRVIPPNAPQANKNLLLKAVADAQRSIAQTPSIGTNAKPDALFTKKYKEKLADKVTKKRITPMKQKSKLQDIISHISKNVESTVKPVDDSEYVPKPVKRSECLSTQVQYIPSPKECKSDSEKKIQSPNFIVTMDGIDKSKYDVSKAKHEIDKTDIESDGGNRDIEKVEKTTEKKRRTPSPIIFDKNTSPVKKTINVPDLLPKVHASPSVKNKERCKYWPNCRQGEKCEFVHPSSACKTFPQCKFGDKCVYIHPNCKFESSCTRRDCPYNHSTLTKSIVPRTPVQVQVQTCKFYPNCTNVHCTFYHPRPCKFGKFCKNQSECSFVHPKTANLTWRSHLQV